MKQGTNYYASCETFPNINIHEPQAGPLLGFPARELVQFVTTTDRGFWLAPVLFLALGPDQYSLTIQRGSTVSLTNSSSSRSSPAQPAVNAAISRCSFGVQNKAAAHDD